MASTTSPYNLNDSYVVKYKDGESSVERVDKTYSLKSSNRSHTVLEGETLQSISFRYYGDSGRWGDIATFNGIIDPFSLEVGDSLQIPL